MILILFAFVAGLVTILSPCILPMVPLVLATGTTGGRARPLAVVAGLVASFTLFTLGLTALVQILDVPGDLLRWVGISVLVVMGLALLVPAFGARLEPLFGRLSTVGAGRGGNGVAGGLLVGATLGLVWAPCVGPIMATVIVLAAGQQITALSVGITLAYALGAGVPLLALAYGGRALVGRLRGRLGNSGQRVQQALGVLILVTSLFIATGQDLRLQTAVGSYLPGDWGRNLFAWEEGPVINQELAKLRGNESGVGAVAPSTVADEGATAPAASSPDLPALAAAVPTATTVPAPTATAAPPTAVAAPRLPDLGLAPELTGTGQWFNGEATTLQALRGKVVLVNFWTFACYNCNNTLPYVKTWYDKYEGDGFVILGVHTPEFAYEHEANNVASAIKDKGIKYPVVQDNDYKTWSAYKNNYWPAFYYVDAQGHIRYTHFGEGAYEEQDQVIAQLLAEARAGAAPARGPGLAAPAPGTDFSPHAVPTATLRPATPRPATPRPTVAPVLALPDLGLAPELAGLGTRFNSAPASLRALRGKVVLLNFWTFGCYNCNNTLPYVKAWYDKYKAQGLVVLGVHTPEFAYERVANNVAGALRDKGIKYPVVQDNSFRTWNAYHNQYWPAFYFIDARGHLRASYFGEGHYAENEQVIQQLLAEAAGR